MILTDEQVQAIVDQVLADYDSDQYSIAHAFARATERAVLAKLRELALREWSKSNHMVYTWLATVENNVDTATRD